jgi:hypothetical protein
METAEEEREYWLMEQSRTTSRSYSRGRGR